MKSAILAGFNLIVPIHEFPAVYTVKMTLVSYNCPKCKDVMVEQKRFTDNTHTTAQSFLDPEQERIETSSMP